MQGLEVTSLECLCYCFKSYTKDVCFPNALYEVVRSLLLGEIPLQSNLTRTEIIPFFIPLVLAAIHLCKATPIIFSIFICK